MSDNTIHRVFLSNDAPVSSFAKDNQMWELLNPDWDLQVWGYDVFALRLDHKTEQLLDFLFLNDQGEDRPSTIEAAEDLVGQALVAQFGGVYQKSSVIPYILPGVADDF